MVSHQAATAVNSPDEEEQSAGNVVSGEPRLHWRSARVATYGVAAVALIAVAIACVALVRTQPASFSQDKTAQAKTHLCAAFATVKRGVVANTHLYNPNPQDVSGQLAVSANARLALLGGGAYLHGQLIAEPAAPNDLAQAIGDFANTVEQLGVNYLAGVDESLQVPLRRDVDSEITRTNGLCG